MEGPFSDLEKRIREQAVITRIREGRFIGNVYLVGGAVREIALGRAPGDYDFVVDREADLQRFESLFCASSFILGKKPVQAHRIVAGDLSLDVVLFDGRIENDLARRDFTINSIAYDVKGDKIIDPLGGLGDLSRKVIRYQDRRVIADDPLRMLKAVRHFAVLREFRLDHDLKSAIRELGGLIHQAAPERIKYEMDQIMESGNAFEGIKAMEDTGLLFELFPALKKLREMDEEKGFVLTTYGHTVDGFKYISRYGGLYGLSRKSFKNTAYALLFHDLGKAFTFSYDEGKGLVHFFYHERHSVEIASAVMDALRFSVNEQRAILALIESHMRIFLISGQDTSERAVRRVVYKMEDRTPELVVLTLCDMYGSSGGEENTSTRRVEERCGDIIRTYHEWRKAPLPRIINGHDLLALGYEPGPMVGKVLADVREKQISGEIRERAEALEYAGLCLPLDLRSK